MLLNLSLSLGVLLKYFLTRRNPIIPALPEKYEFMLEKSGILMFGEGVVSTRVPVNKKPATWSMGGGASP